MQFNQHPAQQEHIEMHIEEQAQEIAKHALKDTTVSVHRYYPLLVARATSLLPRKLPNLDARFALQVVIAQMRPLQSQKRTTITYVLRVYYAHWEQIISLRIYMIDVRLDITA